MREHIRTTFEGLAADVNRLAEAMDSRDDDDVVRAGMDMLERLFEERVWLVNQPISSLIDDEARLAMTRYRLLIVRGVLLGERYSLEPSGPNAQAWIEGLTELMKGAKYIESFPD
jgi:hypothetical protein